MGGPRKPKTPPPRDQPWLDAAGAAAYLNVTENHFRYVASRVPGFPAARDRPGLRLLWARKELDAWVDG